MLNKELILKIQEKIGDSAVSMISSDNLEDKRDLFFKILINEEFELADEILASSSGKFFDLNYTDFEGKNILQRMAERDLYKQVEWLAKKGCDIDNKDNLGFTSLLNAVRLKSPLMVETLLNSGANPDIYNPLDHMTPLLHAVLVPNGSRMVKALLEKNADPHKASLTGTTPLLAMIGQSSTHFDEKSFEKLMEKKVNPNVKMSDGQTVLHYACEGSSNISDKHFKMLLDAGADINAKCTVGNSPLHLLMTKHFSGKNVNKIKMLIERGADLNTRLSFFEKSENQFSNRQTLVTPIMMAFNREEDYDAWVFDISEKGSALLEQAEKEGWGEDDPRLKKVHHRWYKGIQDWKSSFPEIGLDKEEKEKDSIIEKMLSKGAEPRYITNTNSGALVNVIYGYLNLAQKGEAIPMGFLNKLKKYGVDLNTINIEGISVWHLVALLPEEMDKINPGSRKEIIEYFINDLQIKPSCQNYLEYVPEKKEEFKFFKHPLAIAIEKRDYELFKMLVSSGFDISELKDFNKCLWTALANSTAFNQIEQVYFDKKIKDAQKSSSDEEFKKSVEQINKESQELKERLDKKAMDLIDFIVSKVGNTIFEPMDKINYSKTSGEYRELFTPGGEFRFSMDKKGNLNTEVSPIHVKTSIVTQNPINDLIEKGGAKLASYIMWKYGVNPLESNSMNDTLIPISPLTQSIMLQQYELTFSMIDYLKRENRIDEAGKVLFEISDLIEECQHGMTKFFKGYDLSRYPVLKTLAFIKEKYPEVMESWLNYKNSSGCSPLMMASLLDQDDFCSAYLSWGANPNEKSAVGETALHYAASSNSGKAIPYLKDKKADLFAKTDLGVSIEDVVKTNPNSMVYDRLKSDDSVDYGYVEGLVDEKTRDFLNKRHSNWLEEKNFLISNKVIKSQNKKLSF